jgi:GT2 family glycosyltransferase
MPAVSVIIVNFNGAHLLADCLGSLSRQVYRDFETIVVDNGSRDGSVAAARALMPAARVIALPENVGFAAGNNVGIRAAAGKYIVLLNNDTWAEPTFLGELVAAAEADETVGMVAPKILNYFDRRIIDSVGGLLLSRDGIGQGRGRGEVDEGQYDDLREVLLPSGCAALYRQAMLAETGLFAEGFFAYCEDTDLGLRGVWAGWKAVAAPKAVVLHKYSATTGGAYSPRKLFLVERNHYYVALRNYPPALLAWVPLWTLYRLLLMVVAVLRGKGKGQAAASGRAGALAEAFLKAHAEALRHAGEEYRRGRVFLRRLTNRDFAAILRRHRLPLATMVFNA